MDSEDAPVTFDEAMAVVEAVARWYREMPYEKLKALTRTSEFDRHVEDHYLVRGPVVRITTMLGRLGWIRPRVTVEVTAAAKDESLWQKTPRTWLDRILGVEIVPFTYFERFPDARDMRR